ncbi:hypothetical protein ACR6HW_13740 [Fusibacter sp. JL298sf-3]
MQKKYLAGIVFTTLVIVLVWLWPQQSQNEVAEQAPDEGAVEPSSTVDTTASEELCDFSPPHFKVSGFEVRFDTEAQELVFTLAYRIDEELYRQLESDVTYYLEIEPMEAARDGDRRTDLLEGPVPSDGKLGDYTVALSMPWTEEMPYNVDQMRYTLYIYNSAKEPVQVFVDVEAYNAFGQ